MKKAMDFISNGDPTFRKNIDGCLVGFSKLMEDYRQHVAETPTTEGQKTPAEFLGDDPFLEMMVKDFGCYDSALYVMKKYSELIF